MSFNHKRESLNANTLLRKSSTDDIISNLYFTPELNKTNGKSRTSQWKVAYELRIERSFREEII